MDGTIYYSNPIQIADKEWKLIWDTTLCEYPDIILSLGTAYNPLKPLTKGAGSTMRLGLANHGKSHVQITKDHIQATFDCEKTWADYKSSLPAHVSNSRFVRFNVALMEDPPPPDDVRSMRGLQDQVREQLSGEVLRHEAQKLAMQLVATSFYFETDRVQQFIHNTATATG